MFFKKLLAPAEVKLCLSIFQDFLKVDDDLNLSLLKNDVEQLLLDKEAVLYTLLQDKVRPTDLVLMLISNVAQQKLSSGNFHVYRGVLSFSGKQLFKLWNKVNGELVTSGFQKEEIFNEDKQNLEMRIKDVG